MADSNRSELPVESNVLLRRATWCGIVFALAIVLTCLNCMPPIDVHYQVRSEIVVSESRLEQLQQLALADRAAVKKGEHKRVQLLSVKVLDLADQEASLATEATAEKVVLVEVGTLWAGRCTSERHFNWLKNISQINPAKLVNRKSAQTARFARWELAAAQHYQSQHQFMLEKERLPEPELPANITATGERSTFRLASHNQPADVQHSSNLSHPASLSSGDADFGLQLSAQLKQAKVQLDQAEQAWQQELEQSSGALQIASAPVIAPRSTTIPMWLAASVLILGLATGSTAGWLQLRLQSGGAFVPSNVAEQLALESIPIAGRLRLPGGVATSVSSLDVAGPMLGPSRRLTRLSEWALSFWVVLAVGRFLLDALWRDVLIDSPLAALGRLLTGMP